MLSVTNASGGWLLLQTEAGRRRARARPAPALRWAGKRCRPTAAPCESTRCRLHSGAAENTQLSGELPCPDWEKLGNAWNGVFVIRAQNQPLVLFPTQVCSGTLSQRLQSSQRGHLPGQTSFPKHRCLGRIYITGTRFSVCSEMTGHFWNESGTSLVIFFFFQFVRVGSLSALCQTGLHRFCEDDGGWWRSKSIS